jgi:ABC-type sugar transport system ATPase subunit
VAALTLKGISKGFGATPVLHEIDLDIADGEFLTLVGPSGCGKSTLLRIIAGLERQDAGTVAIDGRGVDHLRAHERKVAMVFQNYALYPHMSVFENIALPLTMSRLNLFERIPLLRLLSSRRRAVMRQITAEVKAVAEQLRIEAYFARRPGQLSGGQRQRVALGRAMVRDPDVFLMDEPLSNLDAKLRVHMRTELAELHARLAVTMVYVTHDQVEAMTMSDRVAVFSTGNLRQIAEPRRLYEEPDSLFVARFLGESNALAATVTRCDGEQCAAVLPGGETVLATAVGTCDAGAAIDLVLRPEKVALGAAAQGCANRFAARVVEATFLGDQVRVRLAALGREDFVIKQPNAAGQGTLEPGALVEIGWRTEDCRALAR